MTRSARRARVLLVTHETSRTGAPRVALLVARTLRADGHPLRIISRRPGPILPEFVEVATTSIEPGYRIRARLGRMSRARPFAALVDALWATATLLRHRPSIVYVNSTAASVYLRAGAWLGLPVVLHVHESEPVAAIFLQRDRTRHLLGRATLVACSPSVRDDLARLSGLDSTRIVLVPSVPDDARVAELSSAPPDRAYAEGPLVVGCCGAVELRKGADLWSEVAAQVRAALPGVEVRFVWVGEIVDEQIAAAAVGVEFVGPSDNPYAHMRRFDVATLPSRDDPFPLVVLESMLAGTPVVAFGVGGVADQIGDAGIVVPPGDVPAFAAAVTGLLRDADERARLGSAAYERAIGLYSTAAFARRLEDVVADLGGTR